MKVFSFDELGADGVMYSVRLLGTEREIATLKQQGIVPEHASEVVGLQHIADSAIAAIEQDLHVACGGLMQ